MIQFFIVYWVLACLLAVALYGSDKLRARRHDERISEVALLSVALLGGALGAWIAMYLFRHKTRKALFVVLVPLFFLLHCYLFYRLAVV